MNSILLSIYRWFNHATRSPLNRQLNVPYLIIDKDANGRKMFFVWAVNPQSCFLRNHSFLSRGNYSYNYNAPTTATANGYRHGLAVIIRKGGAWYQYLRFNPASKWWYWGHYIKGSLFSVFSMRFLWKFPLKPRCAVIDLRLWSLPRGCHEIAN